MLLQSQIESLELEIPELGKKRTICTKIKDDVNRLQDRVEQLQRDSQTILDELLEASMMLSRMNIQVKYIASELADCGYARTRRERLQENFERLLKGFR